MTVECYIYQARNGLIFICIGNARTPLTKKQIDELYIPVLELDDFDFDLYKKAYGLE